MIVAVAALAGPTRAAHALRGLAARYLWGRPVLIYTIVFAVFALFVAWGPTLAFRQPVSIAVIAILLVVGTEALRRQVRTRVPPRGTTPAAAYQRIGRLRHRVSDDMPACAAPSRARDGPRRT